MEIDPIRKSMHVMGLHLGQYTTMSLYIYIDSILSSAVIEGSYFETKQELIDDITYNQGKYRRIFDNIANLKVLNYLVDCNKMDSVPYKTDYAIWMVNGRGLISSHRSSLGRLYQSFNMEQRMPLPRRK